jgi:hypothetical protein
MEKNPQQCLQLPEKDWMTAEIERLRTQCGEACRYWEARWRDEKAENEQLRERYEFQVAANRSLVEATAKAMNEVDRLRAELTRTQQA